MKKLDIGPTTVPVIQATDFVIMFEVPIFFLTTLLGVILGSLFSKKLSGDELKKYLSNISDETLYAYNVYQIEGEGRKLFSDINGDENTIMGLPIDKIKDYLKNYE